MGNEPYHFGPKSRDENNTELAPLSPKLHCTPMGENACFLVSLSMDSSRDQILSLRLTKGARYLKAIESTTTVMK
ncbi:hypothetical protein TNCV_2486731 [Trichonephila clavipes]|uniref:Uncharacterized protein n=1 Tax=Trichonephila clavipes TaxID=2585209 RepID=A0A8X6VZN7_TRICX|nr:hypothetical protein TNCV_2486731 [Trichonephila clavipes]